MPRSRYLRDNAGVTIAGALLPIILPVFALVLMGKLIVLRGLIDAAGIRGLTNTVFWLALPALLFLSVVQNPLPDGLGVAGLYFGVALMLFGLALLAGRRWLDLSAGPAAVFALNAVFGNTVLLGIPIVGAIWGGSGLGVLLSIIAAHSLVLLPLTSFLVELGEGRRRAGVHGLVTGPLLGSLKNPIIASIVLAALWRSTGLPLPDAPRRFLDLLGQAAPALSLICLGASLPGFGRASFGREAMLATALKLGVMPLAMALAAAAAGLAAETSAVMVLTAALPTGANAFLLARRSDALIESSAATVVVGTVLSIATLTVALAWLR